MKISKQSLGQVIQALNDLTLTGNVTTVRKDNDVKFMPHSVHAQHLCDRLVALGEGHRVAPAVDKSIVEDLKRRSALRRNILQKRK